MPTASADALRRLCWLNNLPGSETNTLVLSLTEHLDETEPRQGPSHRHRAGIIAPPQPSAKCLRASLSRIRTTCTAHLPPDSRSCHPWPGGPRTIKMIRRGQRSDDAGGLRAHKTQDPDLSRGQSLDSCICMCVKSNLKKKKEMGLESGVKMKRGWQESDHCRSRLWVHTAFITPFCFLPIYLKVPHIKDLKKKKKKSPDFDRQERVR